MTKQRWLIACVLLIAIGLVIGFGTGRGKASDPTFKGRRLSVWIRDIPPIKSNPDPSKPGRVLYFPLSGTFSMGRLRTPNHRAAAEAIREMGTNCIPYLLELVYYRDSRLKTSVVHWSRKSKWLDLKLQTAEERRVHALPALAELGGPAVWAWVDMLTNKLSQPELRGFAAWELKALGPRVKPAVPVLLELWMQPDCDARPLIFETLLNDPDRFVRSLVEVRDGWNIEVRSCAAQRLGSVGQQYPQFSIRALCAAVEDESHWVRHSAIESLGNFGTNALSATNLILRAMRDPEERVREAATNTFRKLH